MTIYTSSWFTRLPPTMVRIGISRGTPRGMPAGYRMYQKLAPGSYFRSVSVDRYKELYFEGLSQMSPEMTVAAIDQISGGEDCALLCYEHPRKYQDWCHRGFVSAWLYETLGLEVFEHGLEDEGCGWRHPKIPNKFRARAPTEPIDIDPYLGRKAFHKGKTWSVVGRNPDQVDQALIEGDDGERVSISEDILKSRFSGLL